MNIQVPLKPSEVIKLGLHCLREIEKDPAYKVDMSTWHTPKYQGHINWLKGKGWITYVCFAGCVMAKKLNVPRKELADNYSCKGYMDIIEALHWFSKGEVQLGITQLGISGVCLSSFSIPSDKMFVSLYSEKDSGMAFKDDMKKIIKALEASDL